MALLQVSTGCFINLPNFIDIIQRLLDIKLKYWISSVIILTKIIYKSIVPIKSNKAAWSAVTYF